MAGSLSTGVPISRHFLMYLQAPDPAWPTARQKCLSFKLRIAGKIFAHLTRLMNRVMTSLPDLILLFDDGLRQILRFGLKQKRRKKPNVCQALVLESLASSLQTQNAHSSVVGELSFC